MALTQISTAGVKDDAVTSGKIPANAVGSSELADDAVDTNAIQNNAVTSLKIAAGAVTQNELGAAVVTTAKIDDDAVDASKLASNAVVTASIQDGNVTLDKLPNGTGSNNGKFLRANNGASPTFETVSSDLVNDTSPQLGGDLASNGNDILMGDNDEIKLGAGGDLKLEHQSSNGHSYITEVGTGNLYIQASNLILRDAGTSEHFLDGNQNGAVNLYHNGQQKLQTTANGVDVQAEGSAVELRLKDSGGTLRGYVYGNNSNQFGFLDSGGNWPIQNTLNTKTEFRVGSTKKLTIDSDGLKFGSDTAAANALHDYEEGTWTPVGNISGVGSVSSATCRYTKIGRMVQLTARFTPSGSSGSSNLIIGGLPFTSGSHSETAFLVMHDGFDEGGSQEPVLNGHISSSSSNLSFYYTRTNGAGWIAVIGTEAVNHEVIFSTTYYTDS